MLRSGHLRYLPVRGYTAIRYRASVPILATRPFHAPVICNKSKDDKRSEDQPLNVEEGRVLGTLKNLAKTSVPSFLDPHSPLDHEVHRIDQESGKSWTCDAPHAKKDSDNLAAKPLTDKLKDALGLGEKGSINAVASKAEELIHNVAQKAADLTDKTKDAVKKDKSIPQDARAIADDAANTIQDMIGKAVETSTQEVDAAKDTAQDLSDIANVVSRAANARGENPHEAHGNPDELSQTADENMEEVSRDGLSKRIQQKHRESRTYSYQPPGEVWQFDNAQTIQEHQQPQQQPKLSDVSDEIHKMEEEYALASSSAREAVKKGAHKLDEASQHIQHDAGEKAQRQSVAADTAHQILERGAKAADGVKEFMQNKLEAGQQLAEDTKEFAKDQASQATRKGKRTVDAAKQYVKGKAAEGTQAAEQATRYAKDKAQEGIQAGERASEAAKDKWEQGKEAVGETAKYAKDKAQQSTGLIGGAIQFVKDKAQQGVDEATQFVKGMAQQGKEAVGDATQFVKDKAQQGLDAAGQMGEVAEKKAQQGKQTMDEATEFAKGKVQEGKEGAARFAKDKVDQGKRAAAKVSEAASSTVHDVEQSAKDTAGKAMEAGSHVKELGRDIAEDVKDMAKDTVQDKAEYLRDKSEPRTRHPDMRTGASETHHDVAYTPKKSLAQLLDEAEEKSEFQPRRISMEELWKEYHNDEQEQRRVYEQAIAHAHNPNKTLDPTGSTTKI